MQSARRPVRFLTAVSKASHQQPPLRIPPRAMSDSPTTNNVDAAAAPARPSEPEKKQVKILMIHGFTQNGTLFRAKTRAIEKTLTKLLAPAALVPHLIYATGPILLRPRDVPSYEPASTSAQQDADNADNDDGPDTRAWWRRNDATGRYAGIGRGMAAIAATIRDADGVDGVVGFSQGGAVAGLVAAALETRRHDRLPPSSLPTTTAAAAAAAAATDDPDSDDSEKWVATLRAANKGRPLRFAVVYSGFRAADPAVGWLFEPAVETPTLHFVGSLDTIVDEARSRSLIETCRNPLVVTHPGGHHVPVSREWVVPLAGFVRQHVSEGGDSKPLL